jgi:hypothetical protein
VRMRHNWCDLRSRAVPPSGDLLSVVVPPFSTPCALTGIVAAIPRAPGDLRFIAVEPPTSHHIQGDDARPEWAWREPAISDVRSCKMAVRVRASGTSADRGQCSRGNLRARMSKITTLAP